MPSSIGHRSPREAGDFARTVLGPSLHQAYDGVLQEPVPAELLAASGIGPAKWDAFRTACGTQGGQDHDGGTRGGR